MEFLEKMEICNETKQENGSCGAYHSRIRGDGRLCLEIIF